MKKRISSIRKIFVTVLAAALISGMTVPAAAFAQEAETTEDPVIMEEENSETELQKAETSEEEEITDAETPEEESTEAEKATEIETEELADTEDPTVPDTPGTEDPTEKPEGEDPAGTETPGTETPGTETPGTETPGKETPVIPPFTIPPMAMAVPMDTSDSMYAELSQLLSRISDRFQVYTVAVIDPMTQQPVIADEPVDVSLIIPAGYNAGRTFVKEIKQTADAQSVSWDDVAYRNEDGKALFGTDHSGLFVVIEIPDTPDKLEMTSKVEKLELTKAYPSGTFPMLLKYSTAVPLTGDDYSVLIWGGVTVLAAAAVIAGIIIIIKRRK